MIALAAVALLGVATHLVADVVITMPPPPPATTPPPTVVETERVGFQSQFERVREIENSRGEALLRFARNRKRPTGVFAEVPDRRNNYFTRYFSYGRFNLFPWGWGGWGGGGWGPGGCSGFGGHGSVRSVFGTSGSASISGR